MWVQKQAFESLTMGGDFGGVVVGHFDGVRVTKSEVGERTGMHKGHQVLHVQSRREEEIISVTILELVKGQGKCS